MIEILKNVPIPDRYRTRSKLAAVLKEMEVLDCFDLPDVQNAANVYYAAECAGVKITIRKHGTGIRVWRVADE